MGKPENDLGRIKAHIRKHGPTEIAHRTKVSRRALQYLLNGKQPTFRVYSALMEDMRR